jgi:hypothetical protein
VVGLDEQPHEDRHEDESGGRDDVRERKDPILADAAPTRSWRRSRSAPHPNHPTGRSMSDPKQPGN